MPHPNLDNSRGNKIVTFLTDAKLKLDAEYSRLATEFGVLSNYPPKPTGQQLKTWVANLKIAADVLISRAEGLADDAAAAESMKKPTGAGGGALKVMGGVIESNYPPGSSK